MSYNLLKGKRGIIFGALNEQSIAWKVAEKAVEEVQLLHYQILRLQFVWAKQTLWPRSSTVR